MANGVGTVSNPTPSRTVIVVPFVVSFHLDATQVSASLLGGRVQFLEHLLCLKKANQSDCVEHPFGTDLCRAPQFGGTSPGQLVINRRVTDLAKAFQKDAGL